MDEGKRILIGLMYSDSGEDDYESEEDVAWEIEDDEDNSAGRGR